MTDEQEVGDSPLIGLDPTHPWFISSWGRKGSGKSYGNRLIYQAYPFDKIAIDVNGNADPGPDAEPFQPPIPTAYPVPTPVPGEPRRPRNLHHRAHPGHPSWREHLDQVVGAALYPQRHRTCLWAGEVGALMKNGKPGPHMETLLQQNRHYNVMFLADGPRPVYVDPLTLSQSDFVLVYELPNPRDRERIADEIGFPPKEFHREYQETIRRGDHWFLLWDGPNKRLCRHHPLPSVEPERPAHGEHEESAA